MKTQLKIIAIALCVVVQTMVTKTRDYDLKNVESVSLTHRKVNSDDRVAFILHFNDNTNLTFCIEPDDQGDSICSLFSPGYQYFSKCNRITFDIDSQKRLYCLIKDVKDVNDPKYHNVNYAKKQLLDGIKRVNPSIVDRMSHAHVVAAQQSNAVGFLGSIKNALTTSTWMYGVTFGAICIILSRLRAV